MLTYKEVEAQRIRRHYRRQFWRKNGLKVFLAIVFGVALLYQFG